MYSDSLLTVYHVCEIVCLSYDGWTLFTEQCRLLHVLESFLFHANLDAVTKKTFMQIQTL